MDTNNFNPAQYGATPFDPTSMGATPVDDSSAQEPQKSLPQNISDILRTVGLGALPTIAGAGYEVYRGAKSLAGDQNAYYDQKSGQSVQNPFMTEDEMGKFGSPVGGLKEAAKNTAGLASFGVPEVELAKGAGIGVNVINQAIRGALRGELYGTSQGKGTNPAYAAGGAILEPIFAALNSGMVTKKGVYSKMEAAAAKGEDINWTDVADLARKQVVNKPTSIKKAMESLISQETPVMHNGGALMSVDAPGYSIPNPSMSSSEALNLRGELGSRLQKDVLGNLKIPVSSAEQNATNILRRVVSQSLKDAAPDITTPDKLYSFYSKMHGDAPTWAKRIIVAEIAKHVLGGIPGIGAITKNIPLP